MQISEPTAKKPGIPPSIHILVWVMLAGALWLMWVDGILGRILDRFF